MDLKNRHYWIIGASSGIGRALAKQLAAQGAILALSARRSDQLRDLADELDGDGHLVLPMDVSNLNDIDNALSLIKKDWPKLDSMIFLAAIYAADHDKQKDLSFIKASLDVNLGGVFNMTDRLRPFYQEQGFGELIFTGSVAGFRGLPNAQPYSATKAAIINYAESLKIELEDQNIKVKLINPGFVKTDMTAQNDFEMPMAIEVDEAAHDIIKGLKRDEFEIHFPKQFTFIMKLIDILPNALYFMLTRAMQKKLKKP